MGIDSNAFAQTVKHSFRSGFVSGRAFFQPPESPVYSGFITTGRVDRELCLLHFDMWFYARVDSEESNLPLQIQGASIISADTFNGNQSNIGMYMSIR